MDNSPMEIDLVEKKPVLTPVSISTGDTTSTTMTSDMTSRTFADSSQNVGTATMSVESSKTDGALTTTIADTLGITPNLSTSISSKAKSDGISTSDTSFNSTIASDAHSSTVVQSPLSQTRASSQASVSGKRKQKQLLLRDVNAPKAPLSAYLQFLNKTRDAIKSQNPGIGVHDITKILGTMWSEMPFDQKQVFLEQAERDKKQYVMDLEQYHKSDTYKRFIEQRENALKVLKQEEKASPGSHLVCIPCNKWFENAHNFREHVKSRKHQRNLLEAKTCGKKSKKSARIDKQDEAVVQKKAMKQAISASAVQVNSFPDMSAVSEGDLNVPVFSDAFLHYNKSRESELRKLRKATTELEEQNAILSKHIDNLNSATGKLENEKTESEEGIKILEPFLSVFHELLSRRFTNSGLSDADTKLTESNISEFLVQLSKNYSSCDSKAIAKLRRVLNELDYPNCLNKKS